MDSANKEIIKQNEKLFRNLDIRRLDPYLKESKIFTESMLKDIYDPNIECDLYSELPTRGPKAFSSFLEILEKSYHKTEVNTLMNLTTKDDLKSFRELEFYSMDSKPLGYCLIINNEDFSMCKDDDGKKVEFRHGSDVDVKELRNLFQKLGYIVEEFTNLKGNKMKLCLENFSKSDFLKSVHCCFIIILSHGGNINNRDVVYGIDGVSVEKYEVYNYFNNVNCENLKRKPKIFLFQACRGKKEDSGAIVKSSKSIDSADSCKLAKFPKITDMIVIHSSLPYHKAYRNHIHGSWLIQDLVSVISEKYQHEDFEAMLKRVSKNVVSRLSKDDNKQAPHIEYFHFEAYFHICSNDEFKGCDMSVRKYIRNE